MCTPDLAASNVEKIAEIFPHCVTEAHGANGELQRKIDWDLLRQELSSDLVEGVEERYRLDWPGKRQALYTGNMPIDKTLRPCRSDSVDFDRSENLFIEGDNLDVLKLLQHTYMGKVKMIYIDPPYNTGKDFIYRDNYATSKAEYLRRSSQVDDAGNRLVANNESNGRFHSDWLSMIYPRLRLAQKLLRDDGVIFISIDDNEQASLKRLCDEVFGEGNFVANFIWAAGRKNDSKLVSVSHESIICYVRDKIHLKDNKIIWRQRKNGLSEIYSEYERLRKKHSDSYKEITKDMKAWYKNLADNHPSKKHNHYSHVDSKGIYFPSDISWPGGGGPRYEVMHPNTGKPVKIPSRGWMFSDPDKMQECIDAQLVHFGEDENSVPCLKSYLRDKEFQAPYSVFYQDGRAASKRLRALMGGVI